ncbi:MAG: ComF family protein [Syntrophomonas sp.]|nr:ComF family protein [Syntrophomonas sp.]
MFDPLLDILFPQEACCICRKPGKYGCRQPWCQECADKMIELQCSCSICEKCGKYLEEGKTLCTDCRNNPPQFDVARAVGPYEEPYRIATKVLKFMGRKHLAPQMGNMMVKKIEQEPRFGKIDIIVPVPISHKGLQKRGFNQTELLARQISKELGVKMDSTVIHRVKETPSQTELSREEREKNLLCAFEVTDKKKVSNKSVLLVDDVYTTGSTGRECTRTLLGAGAVRVCIITWATGKGF